MDTPLWVQIWEMKQPHIAIFAVFLLLILLVMIFRDRLSRSKHLLNTIKVAILGVSFVYAGLFLKAQPTSTNITIVINSLKDFRFPLMLYLMEPFIFLSFAFIILTVIIWGRGVFCGFLCPYGAMLELFNKIYHSFFPKGRLTLPEKVHNKLIYLKYVILLLIVGVAYFNFMLSEYMTEVEPFRTLVLMRSDFKLTFSNDAPAISVVAHHKLYREWYFALYFAIVTLGSVFVYRAFCRYICPLGAAIAAPAFIRQIPLVKMKRHDNCTRCRICGRDCQTGAIMPDGTIDTRECIDCLDCQVNYRDDQRCPALKKREKAV